MFLGGILYVFAYVTPMLLGILMLMLNKTFGKSCALTTYAAVSVLSLILVTEKESVLLYAFFFGYYPIIKVKLDCVKSKLLQIMSKGLLFNVALAAVELLSFYAFGIPFFEDGQSSVWIIAAFAAAMNVIFIMFEFLLNKYYILYEKRLEPQIKKIFK